MVKLKFLAFLIYRSIFKDLIILGSIYKQNFFFKFLTQLFYAILNDSGGEIKF